MKAKLRVMLGIIITGVMVTFIPSSVFAANGMVKVSYYGGGGPNECGPNRTCHGSRTACGQVFDMNKVSVAHESLPCGTKVQFCNNGTCEVATVNDTGNFKKLGREYDLSRKLARLLGVSGVSIIKAKVLHKK